MASDATYSWNGGTGSASSPSNWTLLPGGVGNTPEIPQSDDSIVMASGDAQFTDMPLPGQDNGTQGGTVFWQGGQIDMINAGTTAGILPNTLVQVTNTVQATATLTSQGATTLAGTLDADANGILSYTVTTNVGTNTGTIEATSGGVALISTGSGASFVNAGTILANAGSIQMAGSLGGTSGYWGLQNGGTVEVNVAVGSQSMVFDFIDGANDWLNIDQLANFQGDVFEFGDGDTVDLGSATIGTIVVANTGSADGTVNMTLEDTGGAALSSFFMTPFPGGSFQTGTFAVQSNGDAGDLQFTASGPGGSTVMTTANAVACFAEGTPIATDRGEVPVEDLQVGDRVRTVIGGKPEPLVWVGHRTIECSRHPEPKQVWPVRIAAGAFGRGKPARDLFLSPDHAVYVEGVLIPVKHLINGSSIAQVPQVRVTYYHLELARHDVVLAAGLPAESYLAAAHVGVFVDRAGPVALHPDLSSRVWEAEGCAPLVVTGPMLDAATRRVRVPGRPATRKKARAA